LTGSHNDAERRYLAAPIKNAGLIKTIQNKQNESCSCGATGLRQEQKRRKMYRQERKSLVTDLLPVAASAKSVGKEIDFKGKNTR